LVTASLFFTLKDFCFAAISLPVKGEKLPVINFPIPKNSVEKIYLGVQGDGFFNIKQIKRGAY